MARLTAEQIAFYQHKLIELQIEHRDLDQAIGSLETQVGYDELQLRRLKKKKLQIKDDISMIQTRLQPDELA
jgi:hypothetical protein